MPSSIPVREEEQQSTGSDPQQVNDQVQRILQSETFKGSEVLRHLLQYLAACYLNGRTDAIKVKEIAREVFGRSENFDSQSDSVVRVHTGRLRSKLAEYYVDQGSDDELILAIPKGSYGLTWHQRRPPIAAPAPEIPIAPQPAAAKPHSRYFASWFWPVLAF